MRALLLLALATLLVPAGSVHAGTLPPMIVSARLYAWRGRWEPVDWKEMTNSETLRVAVQVETFAPAGRVTVRFSLRHVSWQGFHKVVEPADVTVVLRQMRRKGNTTHFQAIFRVPPTHPLQFSQAVTIVTHGSHMDTVTSGVTFEPPMSPAQAPLTLTVRHAFSFCAARPRLSYLSYGVAVRGYVRGIFTGGDGPAAFLVLAHPRPSTTNSATLAARHEGFEAHGFVSPEGTEPVTIAGELVCRPQIGFGIFGVSR